MTRQQSTTIEPRAVETRISELEEPLQGILRAMWERLAHVEERVTGMGRVEAKAQQVGVEEWWPHEVGDVLPGGDQQAPSTEGSVAPHSDEMSLDE